MSQFMVSSLIYVFRSLADQDTDRWVFEVLAPHLRRRMKNLKDEVQWTDLVYETPYQSFKLPKYQTQSHFSLHEVHNLCV